MIQIITKHESFCLAGCLDSIAIFYLGLESRRSYRKSDLHPGFQKCLHSSCTAEELKFRAAKTDENHNPYTTMQRVVSGGEMILRSGLSCRIRHGNIQKRRLPSRTYRRETAPDCAYKQHDHSVAYRILYRVDRDHKAVRYRDEIRPQTLATTLPFYHVNK